MKLQKSILLLFTLLFIQIFTQAQTKELDDFHYKKILEYRFINNDSLIHYSKKLQQSKDSCFVYRAYTVETKGHYTKENYKLAEEISNFVLSNLENKDGYCFKRIKINVLNRLFWIKKTQNEYQEAFNYLLSRKKLVETIEKKDLYYKLTLMRVDIDMANIKAVMDLNKEAIDLLKTTYKNNLSILNDSPIEKASVLNSIGDSYYKLSNDSIRNYLDSAKSYYTKSYDQTKKFKPQHKNSESIYYLRMAELSIITEDYKTAASYLNKHKNIEEEHQTQQQYHYLKSLYYFYTKEIDSSVIYSNKYLYNNKFKTPSDKKNLIKIYSALTEIYFNKNQTDSASKYSRLTLNSIQNFNNSKININHKFHAHGFNKIKELNKSILKKEANKKFIWIGLLLFLLLILSYKISTIYKSNLRKSNRLSKYISKENQPKKEYNIDKSLKDEILKNLEKFEKSTDYLDSDFSIKSLAENLNTNTSYLSSIINSTKNKTYKQYVTDLKIQYLTHKLKTDSKYLNYTIEALGKEIGYTNASSFTRAFKKSMKVTPSEYLKSISEN